MPQDCARSNCVQVTSQLKTIGVQCARTVCLEHLARPGVPRIDVSRARG